MSFVLFPAFWYTVSSQCILWSYLQTSNDLHICIRYAGVPVDFEEVQMDPKSESNEDLEYALTSIRRNGVAIKGNLIILCLLDLTFSQQYCIVLYCIVLYLFSVRNIHEKDTEHCQQWLWRGLFSGL
jgi:hypothetical protein